MPVLLYITIALQLQHSEYVARQMERILIGWIGHNVTEFDVEKAREIVRAERRHLLEHRTVRDLDLGTYRALIGCCFEKHPCILFACTK